MTFFCVKEFFAHNFIRLIKRFDDSSTNTVFEKCNFLFSISFFLKYILNEIHTYVLFSDFQKKSRKIFCAKIFFFNFFWKIIIKLLYINATILYFDLNDFECVTLMIWSDDLIILKFFWWFSLLCILSVHTMSISMNVIIVFL